MQNLLCCKPSTWRINEGTAGRNDRIKPEGDQGLVPEQALQGQEKNHTAEDANAAGEGGNYIFGILVWLKLLVILNLVLCNMRLLQFGVSYLIKNNTFMWCFTKCLDTYPLSAKLKPLFASGDFS